jgi:hypothetical protein
MRMRQVEAERMRTALLTSQSRLARRPRRKPELGRIHSQVASEDNTKAAMRKRKSDSIVGTNKSRGTSTLLVAETGMTAVKHRRISLKRATPEIHGPILQGNPLSLPLRELSYRRKGKGGIR